VTLRAGAATVDITPRAGVIMDGYGARREPSRGVHDPLFARALVLEREGERFAIVSCDLLGIHASITSEVRRLAEKRLGIAPDNLLVCATHNHAGPAGLRGGMFSRLNEALAAMLVQHIIGALDEAVGNMRPAKLKLAQTVIDTISQNRRDPGGPIDRVLRVLLVEGEEGPIASVLNFACHGTVLNGENLMLSAEFPGVACRLLQQQTGAPALYLQGVCGNVNPVWIRQDFESVERAGQIVGSAALRVVAELRALGPGQRAHNIRWDEFPEMPVPGRVVEPWLRAGRREIEVPLREFLSDDEYALPIEELTAKLVSQPEATGERRAGMAKLTRYQNERWAATWARRQPEKTAQRAEIQALSLGEGLALLALPGEFFVETGNAIREHAGDEDVLIASYANDYIGYVIPPAAYDEGGYEAGITFCTPEAEGMIVDASLLLLRQVRATT
jgi:Neutral/alkaline non-lysosomal ceramidase, N-terminal